MTLATSVALVMSTSAYAKVGYTEKEELKFGFIKLTDMALLAIPMKKAILKMKPLCHAWDTSKLESII